PLPVKEIGPHPPVREKTPVLKDVADPPSLGRQVDAISKERARADADMSAIGPQQSGDHIEKAGLAGTRGAKEGGKPRPRCKARGNQPLAAPLRNVDINRHAAVFPRACAERAIRSEEHTSELQSREKLV